MKRLSICLAVQKSTKRFGNSQLMVMGYGFGNSHINDCICKAVNENNLKLFIIDPTGTDILDGRRRTRSGAIPRPFHESGLLYEVHSAVIGASRRDLRATIEGEDRVEHRKLMKFFDPV